MKKTLTLLMALMLGCISAYSVPAKPGVKRTVTLADGSQVELTLRGDEHYSYYTTEDGTPYQLKADGQLLKMTREEVSERWTALRNKHLANTRRANANMKSPRRVGSANVTTGKHRGLVILVEFSDLAQHHREISRGQQAHRYGAQLHQLRHLCRAGGRRRRPYPHQRPQLEQED